MTNKQSEVMILDSYLGYVRLNQDEYSDFYTSEKVPNQIVYENEYVFVEDEVYCYQNNFFRRVNYPIIENRWSGIIKSKNIEQRAAIDMLLDGQSTIKLITGTWGTGKTMLLVTAALKQLEEGKFDKIVWIRNNISVKDTEQLGALPGDELDKVLPWLMPMADHCGGIQGIERLIKEEKLEVIPLGFLRGRSIRNSIIISSEAENLTKEHIQLLIGRVDEGSNLWLDADCRQRDKVVFDKSKGIETMIDRLKGNDLFGYVHLVKSERSQTATLADLLND